MTDPDSRSGSTAAPLAGWRRIAAAVTKAIGRSVSIRTAQRYARPGRRNRLPVFKWDNGVVYLLPSGLALWVGARGLPLGGREPGRRVSPTAAPPTATPRANAPSASGRGAMSG